MALHERAGAPRSSADDERVPLALVHKCVTNVARDVCDREGVRLDSRAVHLLAQLSSDFGRLIACDASRFAQHAGRKRIVVDDILLIARRDLSLVRLRRATR